MTKWRGAAALLMLMLESLLGSCSVDGGAEVAAYREVLSGSAPRPDLAFSPGGPLSLDQALRIAAQTHERLEIAGEDYVRALIARRRAAAAYLPSLDASARMLGSESAGAPNQRPSADPEISLRASQLIFGGDEVDGETARLSALVDAEAFRLQETQESLLIDVARVYFRILQAERRVKVLENSGKVQDERVRDMEARRRVGLARALDVAQNAAQASRTRVLLIDARQDVEEGRIVLEVLVGAPVRHSELGPEFSTAWMFPSLDDACAAALAHRPEVASTQAQVLAAESGLRAAYGRSWPRLAFSSALSIEPGRAISNLGFNVLWSLVAPIFSAGEIEDGVRLALSESRSASRSASLVKREVIQEVKVKWSELLAARARLLELEAQRKAAETALRQADESLRVGLATNLERLVAQDSLLAAELDLAETTFEVRLLELEVLRTTGTMAREFGVRVLVPEQATDPEAEG